MDRTPVVSSNIASVGYETEASILEVEFKNGNLYRFTRVPSAIALGLIEAESCGSYFNRNIKDRFPFERL